MSGDYGILGVTIKRLLGYFIALALLALLIAGGAIRYLETWSLEPQAIEIPEVIEFPPGTGLKELARTLEQRRIINSWANFYVWIRLNGVYPKFQAGQYRFEGPTSPWQVAAAIQNGKVFRPVVLQVTIPEGFTGRKIAERLAAHGVGTSAKNLGLLNDRSLLGKLKIKGFSLEGYLYPATYDFVAIPSPEEAFERMVATFWERLPANYEAQAAAKGLTLQQAITFASLIELETKYADERPLVSGVIWRRLKDRMPLGIDAAIIYGVVGYTGDLRWSDLSNSKNLYNTRIHPGLPPGPIGSVTAASLEAVLTPVDMGYYYYVLMPGTEGRHHFSKTLSEHNRYVQKLLHAIQEERKKSDSKKRR